MLFITVAKIYLHDKELCIMSFLPSSKTQTLTDIEQLPEEPIELYTIVPFTKASSIQKTEGIFLKPIYFYSAALFLAIALWVSYSIGGKMHSRSIKNVPLPKESEKIFPQSANTQQQICKPCPTCSKGEPISITKPPLQEQVAAPSSMTPSESNNTDLAKENLSDEKKKLSPKNELSIASPPKNSASSFEESFAKKPEQPQSPSALKKPLIRKKPDNLTVASPIPIDNKRPDAPTAAPTGKKEDDGLWKIPGLTEP